MELEDGKFQYEGQEYDIASGSVELLRVIIDGMGIPLEKIDVPSFVRAEVEWMDWPDTFTPDS